MYLVHTKSEARGRDQMKRRVGQLTAGLDVDGAGGHQGGSASEGGLGKF